MDLKGISLKITTPTRTLSEQFNQKIPTIFITTLYEFQIAFIQIKDNLN